VSLENNKTTYVYRLAKEALFVEKLQTQYNLQPTENIVKFITEYNAMFLETPAMRNNVCGTNHCLKKIDMYSLDMQSIAFTIINAIKLVLTLGPYEAKKYRLNRVSS
jgi:hypothetical protein